MNALKVYLKSGITKAYHHAQVLGGIFLVINALQEYPLVEYLKIELLLSVVAAVALVLGWVVPTHLRRKLRYLPGLLLAFGGTTLVFLTMASTAVIYGRYNLWIELLGYLMAAAGVLQPLIDVKKVVYFTTEGMRYRSLRFFTKHCTWPEIKGIVFQEKAFSVELNNGKTILMVPYDSESQNLRVLLDKMIHQAKADARANGKSNNGQVETLITQLPSESVA